MSRVSQIIWEARRNHSFSAHVSVFRRCVTCVALSGPSRSPAHGQIGYATAVRVTSSASRSAQIVIVRADGFTPPVRPTISGASRECRRPDVEQDFDPTCVVEAIKHAERLCEGPNRPDLLTALEIVREAYFARLARRENERFDDAARDGHRPLLRHDETGDAARPIDAAQRSRSTHMIRAIATPAKSIMVILTQT